MARGHGVRAKSVQNDQEPNISRPPYLTQSIRILSYVQIEIPSLDLVLLQTNSARGDSCVGHQKPNITIFDGLLHRATCTIFLEDENTVYADNQ